MIDTIVFGPRIPLWPCAYPGCSTEIRWGGDPRDLWYHLRAYPQDVDAHRAMAPPGAHPDKPAPMEAA